MQTLSTPSMAKHRGTILRASMANPSSESIFLEQKRLVRVMPRQSDQISLPQEEGYIIGSNHALPGSHGRTLMELERPYMSAFQASNQLHQPRSLGYASSAPPHRGTSPRTQNEGRSANSPVRPPFHAGKATSGSFRPARGNPYLNPRASSARPPRRDRSRPARDDEDEHDESVEYDGDGNVLTFGKTLPIPNHLSLPQKQELYELQMAMAEEKRQMQFYGQRGAEEAREKHFYAGTKLELEYKKWLEELGL